MEREVVRPAGRVPDHAGAGDSQVELLLGEPDEVLAELPAQGGPVLLEDLATGPAPEPVHPAAVHRVLGEIVEAHGHPDVLHHLEHLPDGMHLRAIRGP